MSAMLSSTCMIIILFCHGTREVQLPMAYAWNQTKPAKAKYGKSDYNVCISMLIRAMETIIEDVGAVIFDY